MRWEAFGWLLVCACGGGEFALRQDDPAASSAGVLPAPPDGGGSPAVSAEPTTPTDDAAAWVDDTGTTRTQSGTARDAGASVSVRAPEASTADAMEAGETWPMFEASLVDGYSYDAGSDALVQTGHCGGSPFYSACSQCSTTYCSNPVYRYCPTCMLSADGMTCTGTIPTCAELTTNAACNAQLGCYWTN